MGRIKRGEIIPLGISWSKDDLGSYLYLRFPVWVRKGKLYHVCADKETFGFKLRSVLIKFDTGSTLKHEIFKFNCSALTGEEDIGKQVRI